MKDFDTVIEAVKFAEEHHIVEIEIRPNGNGKFNIVSGRQLVSSDDASNRIYNLTLYLRWFEKVYPNAFKMLENEFSGMPGYNPAILTKDFTEDEGLEMLFGKSDFREDDKHE